MTICCIANRFSVGEKARHILPSPNSITSSQGYQRSLVEEKSEDTTIGTNDIKVALLVGEHRSLANFQIRIEAATGLGRELVGKKLDSLTSKEALYQLSALEA